MSVTIRTNNPGSIAVQQGAQGTSSIVVKKPGDLTLQSLKNVVTTDLQDGYTLFYDSETNTWVSQPLDSGITLTTVDGGTY
jgi:hypothetical protein